MRVWATARCIPYIYLATSEIKSNNVTFAVPNLEMLCIMYEQNNFHLPILLWGNVITIKLSESSRLGKLFHIRVLTRECRWYTATVRRGITHTYLPSYPYLPSYLCKSTRNNSAEWLLLFPYYLWSWQRGRIKALS